jgi:hypothetical protein
MPDNLYKNILSTVVYYDILDYPLTSFEIWKYLIRDQEIVGGGKEKKSLGDIIRELESDEIKKHLDEYRGFYFLKGRKELVEQRIERNKISEKKFKTIRKICHLIRCVPFVRMIAVTGAVAMKNAGEKSDLDLMVAIKGGRIFTGRILVTGLVHLLGMRRYGKKIANRICLNYFITDKSLEISLKDLFSSSEYSFIVPVFGWKCFREFQNKNEWIKKYRENFQPDEIAGWKIIKDSAFSKSVRRIGELILNFNLIEKNLKKFQMKRISEDPRTMKQGSFVTANDNELIFLPDPQGPEIYEKFKKKMEETILSLHQSS